MGKKGSKTPLTVRPAGDAEAAVASELSAMTLRQELDTNPDKAPCVNGVGHSNHTANNLSDELAADDPPVAKGASETETGLASSADVGTALRIARGGEGSSPYTHPANNEKRPPMRRATTRNLLRKGTSGPLGDAEAAVASELTAMTLRQEVDTIPDKAPRIYGVGHSNHTVDDFFALLRQHSITSIIDVRNDPTTSRHQAFSNDSFKDHCGARGVSYSHTPALADLGDDTWHLLGIPEAKAGLEKLVVSAQHGACAYMSEAPNWRGSHRQVLAQKLLHEHGVLTLHISRDGNLEPHPHDHEVPHFYGMPTC
eukprot:NODE_858_length_1336_cov_690.442623.p1 GENE.NODE_858_length_1336_cov_690.442623~~NODE_858_length_1336_cov_690.442623.p1  ORF type:complete len:312 (-),score=58.85 NODE_858_length_1336_cov_690.442623:383-1318(-)